MKRTALKRILLLICLFSSLSAIENSWGYGERIGIDPKTPVTADFVDTDKDRVDDRYQTGPGIPPPPEPERMLPKVEYVGNAPHKGVPDLRTGVTLYYLWFNLQHNMKSNLIEIPMPITPPKNGIKFSFPNGLQIFFNQNDNLVIINEFGKYSAYQLSKYNSNKQKTHQVASNNNLSPQELMGLEIKYLGTIQKDTARDKILAAMLYKLWQAFEQEQHSIVTNDPTTPKTPKTSTIPKTSTTPTLTPYKHIIDKNHPIFKKLESGETPTYQFNFPNGIRIYYAKNINYLIVEQQDGHLKAFAIK